MRIGIIGSSGGSVARELIAAAGLESDFFILTDRDCGLELLAKEQSLPHVRIGAADNSQFSLEAKNFFDRQGGVDLVLLFYSRLVTSELYDRYRTFNLHPSLLPEYSGFDAIERAYADEVKRFGVTLHQVDETIDGGPVIGQVSSCLKPGSTLRHMRHVSFVQKTHLALYLLDIFKSNEPHEFRSRLENRSANSVPKIQNEVLRRYYEELIIREGLEGET